MLLLGHILILLGGIYLLLGQVRTLSYSSTSCSSQAFPSLAHLLL